MSELNPRGGGGVSRPLKPFSKLAVLFYGFLWPCVLINSDHRYVITLANSDDKTESKYLGTTHQAAGKETEFSKNDSKVIKN